MPTEGMFAAMNFGGGASGDNSDWGESDGEET